MRMSFIRNIVKNKVFIIAEIGVNHNGSLTIAKKSIIEAKKSGADAVKFQSFKAEDLAIKSTPKVKYQINKKSNETHYEMLKKLELNKKKFKSIIKFCKTKNIKFISTPYDQNNAKFLLAQGVKTIKIASADLIDFQLHAFLCKKKKIELILSTGMSNLNEINETLKFYKKTTIMDNLFILQCVSNYPAQKNNQNLNVIPMFKKYFNLIPGFSDHTKGYFASTLAVAAGAKIIEKHFTLNKQMNGPDHKASMNPSEFTLFVKKIRETEKIMGSNQKFCVNEEKGMKKISRKSIVLKKTLRKGQKLSLKNITCKRPGLGILANKYLKLIGKKVNKKMFKDQLVLSKDLY